MHLPFSPGLQNDDRVIMTLKNLEGKEVIVTVKMDGENSNLYPDGFHARSLDSRHHPSRDWLKRFHGGIAYMIPKGWRICGENMYAKHSIYYDNLESYFYGFSLWDDRNISLSVDETDSWFDDLRIVQPKRLYRGIFDVKVLQEIAASLDPIKDEGFVVRVTGEIPFDEFHLKVAKYVRKGHVQTDEHWMTQAIVPNKLKE